MRLRRLIAGKLPSYELSGEVEADESYFGGTRKGTRGRGASGEVAVSGLFKRVGKVFTTIVTNARTETLLPIIEEKVTPDSIVYTDSFKAYNALDVSDFRHMGIAYCIAMNLYSVRIRNKLVNWN
jgi:transposase